MKTNAASSPRPAAVTVVKKVTCPREGCGETVELQAWPRGVVIQWHARKVGSFRVSCEQSWRAYVEPAPVAGVR